MTRMILNGYIWKSKCKQEYFKEYFQSYYVSVWGKTSGQTLGFNYWGKIEFTFDACITEGLKCW